MITAKWIGRAHSGRHEAKQARTDAVAIVSAKQTGDSEITDAV